MNQLSYYAPYNDAIHLKQVEGISYVNNGQSLESFLEVTITNIEEFKPAAESFGIVGAEIWQKTKSNHLLRSYRFKIT